MKAGARSTEMWVAGLIACVAFANLVLALLFLPFSPGLDDWTLFSAIYSFTHYGRLMYPVYDLPLMYIHPPTKSWLVALIVSAGVPLRLALAGITVAAFAVPVAGAFACRVTHFQRLALVFAISTAVTLCPFIAYHPENLTFNGGIGTLRPDDVVLLCWFGGVLWLEAARRSAWRAMYSFIGSASIMLASVSHYFGVPCVAAIAVYGTVAALESPGRRVRRLAPMLLGALVVGIPVAVAVSPYLSPIASLVLNQAGEAGDRSVAAALQRHQADFWFLREWMRRHTANVWAAELLMTGPIALGVPLIVIASVVLLAIRSSRVLAVAALSLPLAVLVVTHKLVYYELPEVTLYVLSCGWLAAMWLERLTSPVLRLAASSAFLFTLVTASPLIWDWHSLTFLDDRNSPELLRAMGRAIVGPGASATNLFYAAGEDSFVRQGYPEDPGVDYVIEREFNLDAAALHDRYVAGRARIAGFILTPETPSTSAIYFTAVPNRARSISGFVTRGHHVQRFSEEGDGWTFKTLSCRASGDDLLWIAPRPATPIAGYVPRVDHCVNSFLSRQGLDGRFASVLLRRTLPNGNIEPRAFVPLLIESGPDVMTASGLRDQCGCETVAAIPGGLREIPAADLLATSQQSERTIRFYSTGADLVAGRSLPKRFFGNQYP